MSTGPLDRYFKKLPSTSSVSQAAKITPASQETAPATTAPPRGRPRGRPRGSGRGGTAVSRPLPSTIAAGTKRAAPESEPDSDSALATAPARGRSRGRPRGSGRGGTKRARRPVRYEPREYPIEEWASFMLPGCWRDKKASDLKPGVKKVTFEDEFPVTDEHLDALVALGPSVCHGIEYFSAGDETTGDSSEMTQPAVIRLAAATPNLTHISLCGSEKLGDDALLALFTNCPNLEHIRLSGRRSREGSLKGPALVTLRDDPSMCPNLVELSLIDQGTHEPKLKRAMRTLSAKRKHLKITVGREESDGYQSYWKGGKEDAAMEKLLARNDWDPPSWYQQAYKAYKADPGGFGQNWTPPPRAWGEWRPSSMEKYMRMCVPTQKY